MHVHPPGCHLRDVEHLIHEVPQMRGRCRNTVNWIDLPWRKIPVNAITQEIDKPDDRIEGRP